MANFTTEVRSICEFYAGYEEGQERDKVHDIITVAMPKVFDFDFPIFDEEYRPVLERKILMHYYTREIALETVALWKLKLEARLNEIMPKYNKLYEVQLFSYNPLWDVDLTEDKWRDIDTSTTGQEARQESSTGQSAEQTANSNSNTNLYSDTPQGEISRLAEGKYLTNATMDSGTTNGSRNLSTNDSGSRNTSTTETVDTTDNYLKHIKGKRGGLTYSKMLEEEVDLIEKLDNIDYRIIRELRDLFFTLWA